MQNKIQVMKNKTILWLQVFWISLMWFYTLHINMISTKWYDLRKLQQEREVLLSHEEELNLKISRAQNFNNLENSYNVKNMVAYWDNISYFNKKSELAKK